MKKILILGVFAILSFNNNYGCGGESYGTYTQLSIFDSPHFLKKTHIKSISLYRELKQHRRSFGKAFSQIKKGYDSFSFSYIKPLVHLGNNGSPCAGDVFKFTSNTRYLQFKVLLLMFQYLKSMWKNGAMKKLNFSSGDDSKQEFIGGLLGLLIIQDTYNVDIELWARGHNSAKYFSNTHERNPRSSLTTIDAIDLLVLAAHAKNLQWYETSALFANHSMRAYFDDYQKNISWYPLYIPSWIAEFTSYIKKRKWGLIQNIKNPGDIFLPFSNRAKSKLHLKISLNWQIH